jgi:membrane-associated phospholipid phosphatase
MRRGECIIFSLLALAILLAIGLKLHELDMPTARFVRSFDIPELNKVGDLLALPGQGGIIAGSFALIGVAGWWFERRRLKEIGFRGLAAQVAVTLVVHLLKHVVGRARPRFAHADEFSWGPSLVSGLDSFPSGHTINAFAAASVLGWYLPNLRTSLLFVAGCVGVSRVVRGSHFPTDVYTAVILGVLIGGLVAAGYRRWKEEVLPGLIRTGVPVVVFAFLVIWIAAHSAPGGPQQRLHLTAGAGLVIIGLMLRAAAFLRKTPQVTLLDAGGIALGVGVAVAYSPWWVAGLLLAAFLPLLISGDGTEPVAPAIGVEKKRGLLTWRREVLILSAAMLGMAILQSVQGILPIG